MVLVVTLVVINHKMEMTNKRQGVFDTDVNHLICKKRECGKISEASKEIKDFGQGHSGSISKFSSTPFILQTKIRKMVISLVALSPM